MKRRKEISRNSLANLELGKFKPGKSGNPKGRTPYSPEIKAIKSAALIRAIEILHEKITDPNYMDRLSPKDLNQFLETAYDRFGLPKVTKLEQTGEGGGPLLIQWAK